MSIKKINKYLFHPYELVFSGYSNSGKTTLITSLLERLSSKYSIGYIKHDAHSFTMDHEGKDTDRAWKNHASQVFISDSTHSALVTSGPIDPIRQKTDFINCDLVFVEGYKKSLLEKIVLVDKKKKILNDIQEGLIDNVLALVGEEDKNPLPSLSCPYFHRDDVEKIADFVERILFNKSQMTPVYGLVLAGGYSKRMQHDKALLVYNGKAQVEYSMDMLSQVCEKTFVSKREKQDLGKHESLPVITDRFLDFGPIGGILSAMTSAPHAAWMVLACDLPLVTVDILENLISQRDPLKMATAYMNTEGTFPEPLCAIYEPKILLRLLDSLALGIKCPKRILEDSPIKKLSLPFNDALMNVNTPEEYCQLQEEILRT